MKKLMAVVLSAALGASGCATANAGAIPRLGPPRDAAMMAGYVRSIPAGSPVRVGLAGGGTLSGTLLGADEAVLVVQPRGRRPEAPREVPIGEVLSVEIQRPSGVGKVIAIGATAGAAATLGVLLVLFAALGGD